MFMSHGLSVSIVKCIVLSCGSACVNQCPAAALALPLNMDMTQQAQQTGWDLMGEGGGGDWECFITRVSLPQANGHVRGSTT